MEMPLSDEFDTLDTAKYLSEFKEKYVAKMKDSLDKLEQQPKPDRAKIEDVREKYLFLMRFCACVEAEIERGVLFKSIGKVN